MASPTQSLHGDPTDDAPRLERTVSRWTATFITWWSYPLLDSIWARLVLFVLILGFCLTRAYVGLTGTQAFSHDAFMFLDGAWRIANGQRPHIDFYSHLGALTFAPTVVGLWMARGTAAAVAYGQGLVAFLLGAWAYLLARKRLSDISAALLSLSVTFMAGSPSALGFAPLTIAPAMIYNRQGYAILALILIEAFAEHRQDRKPNEVLGGFSTGLALAILLFLKITYFVFALLLIELFAALRPQTKQRWIGFGIGFGTLAMLFCAYYGFNFMPMVNDLMTVAHTKHFRLDWYVLDAIFVQAATAWILSLMGAVLLLLNNKRQAAVALACGCLALCIVGVLLPLGNYELNGFPLAVFLAIIVVNSVSVHGQLKSEPSNLWHGLVLLFGAVFIAGFLGISALTMPFAVAVKLRKAPEFAAFASPVLKTFVPIDGDSDYTNWVNQGFSLLRQYRRPGETVMSLDFSNPFSYGLGIKPAPGGTPVLQYRTTFNDAHRQSAQSLFGHADLVMLPNPGWFSDGTLEYSIVRIYGPYLNSHFKLIGKCRYWSLYRRNANAS